MRGPFELRVDVREAAGLGIPAHVAVTIFLPDDGMLSDPPVICFGFPGGGYCRRYYSFDMPDGSGGGEAGFHCERGWIFAACDHLGFGDSTVPEGNALDLENVAAANHAAVQTVTTRLEGGRLVAGFPPIANATKLGIGQSMGGCFTIVAQGQLGTFDGVGILGYSAIHTVVPARPGQPMIKRPWISRSSSLDNPVILNRAALDAAERPPLSATVAVENAWASGEHPFQWAFHYDDEPPDVIAMDMADIVVSDTAANLGGSQTLPEWRSATTPSCRLYMVAPGVVAPEAASITVPVLVAVGERDVVPDPWMEPKAYKSSRDLTVFVCPRMGHMHNFAHTRTLFWQRLHCWGTGVAQTRARLS